MPWILIFFFSLAIDSGAVLYTRAVQKRRIVVGTLTTGALAMLNWLSILMVVDKNSDLMWASTGGHMVGFVLGMLLPLADASERSRPTTEPGSQSSDPS
jgi:hypothetical protein